MSFNYSPQVTSVSEPYFTHSGKTMDVLDNARVAQFKRDTDAAFETVAWELQNMKAILHQFKEEGRHIRDENIALGRMLDWVNSHYPEAMYALECTMKVHAVLDKANQPDDGVMQSP